MYLSSISIRNFRGIESLDMAFDPSMTVIMGENNTCKSTVLSAIQLCLGELKSDKGNIFEIADFHIDARHPTIETCNPIELIVSFVESEQNSWSEAEKQRLNDVNVGTDKSALFLKVTGTYVTETRDVETKCAFLNEDHSEIINSGSKKNIKALSGCVPIFVQDALRDAGKAFGGNSSYWLELIKANDLPPEEKIRFANEIAQVQRQLIEAYGGFPSITDEINHISEVVDVGQNGKVTIEPRFPDLRRTIRYETEVNYQISDQAKIPIVNFGEGTQSLAVMMLFNAYLKQRMNSGVGYTAPIVAVEEPEAHLHPNAIYSIWNALKGLLGQKIIVTHSGEIVAQADFSSIRKLERVGGKVTCREIALELSEKDIGKFRIHFKRDRGALFFSRVWILVEGATEMEVIDRCASIMGVDLHRRGIGLIYYAQIGVESILRFADAFGIKCIVTADHDSNGQKYIETVRRFNANGSNITHSMYLLPSKTVEMYLCEQGYGQPYLNYLSVSGNRLARHLSNIPERQRPSDYWEQVYGCISRNKPKLANEALDLMAAQGEAGVPRYFQDVINAAI